MSINEFITALRDLHVPIILIGASILFLLIALVGGGIKGMVVEVPRITKGQRGGMFFFAALFFILGIFTASVPSPPTGSIVPPSATVTLTPTPLSSSKLYVEIPLSDGRQQAWWSETHAHWIQTRWWQDMNGDWGNWALGDYPPSQAGVIKLDGYILNGITYFTVWLDDGTCWQTHKLTTNPNDAWTSYYKV